MRAWSHQKTCWVGNFKILQDFAKGPAAMRNTCTSDNSTRVLLLIPQTLLSHGCQGIYYGRKPTRFVYGMNINFHDPCRLQYFYVFYFLLLGLLGHVFVEVKQAGVFLLCQGRNTPEECILYITGGVGWETLQGKAEIPKKQGCWSNFCSCPHTFAMDPSDVSLEYISTHCIILYYYITLYCSHQQWV